MTDIKIVYHNESYVKIEADHSVKMELWDYFSFMVESYKFNPKYKAGIWDGKIRLFNLRTSELPIGLITLCKKFADNNEYEIDIDNCLVENSDITEEYLNKWFEAHPMYDGEKQIQPHWYQYAAILEVLSVLKCLWTYQHQQGNHI